MNKVFVEIKKTEAIFNKPDNYYTVFAQCKGVKQKVYYAIITKDSNLIKACVKDSHGKKFYGTAVWDGRGEYNEEYGIKLAILKAALRKEYYRQKRFNAVIREKRKQAESLLKEARFLERERDNNALFETEEMYKKLFAEG